MNDIIYTDRSRIEDHEKCARKRYWRYHWQGKGLERINDLKLDARIGTWVHNGIELALVNAGTALAGNIHDNLARDAATVAGCNFEHECRLVANALTPQGEADVVEGGQIVTALVYAWLKVKAPRLLQDGEVLAIEKELVTDFEVPTSAGHTTVRLLSRPDIIWRRGADGAILIRNLKTVRRADDRFREKWSLDQQTLSEPLAVDAWLNAGEYQEGYGSICGGVIIDGLVTGEVLYDKYRQLFYHNNPLIYAWRQAGVDLDGHETFYPRYEWSCTEPHKLNNGHKCEGGKTHKLSGVKKVAVAEAYPGGIIAWIDYLIANHIDVVEECIVELPPIIRSEYQIERWKRQVLGREVEINRQAKRIDNMLQGSHQEAALDTHFPMSTSNGNCIFPRKCAYYECCHGSVASDPLTSGLFRYRIPNHDEEKRSISEQPDRRIQDSQEEKL